MENLKDSELSNLWIDNPDIMKLFREKNTTNDILNCKYVKKNNVVDFKEKGFTIIKNAISHEDIDKLLKITDDDKIKNDDEIFSSYGTKVDKISEMSVDKPLTKLLDLYAKFNEAGLVLCHDSIKEFLQLMYGEPGKLFQSLYFKKGSTQSLHQDPAYVVIQPHPYNLIAVWVALEDIKEGSGPLMYIPGSHDKLKFRYGNDRIHFNRDKDGDALHNHHLHCLNQMSKEMRTERFYPKKGDILFWHAGLVHGGSEITDESLTRKSIVGHYCPNSENPYYFVFDNNRYSSDYNGMNYVSMYYNKSFAPVSIKMTKKII